MSASTDCRHCGAALAVGAVACFRCGRLVETQAANEASFGGGPAPTQLGTAVRGGLLEGKWRLIKPLGRGAVGEVWQAKDVSLDRDVAVKLMHASVAQEPAQLSRFEREARVLAGLEHPGIISVLGLGRHEGAPFMVMKLLAGVTLAEHLHRSGGAVSAVAATALLKQLCDALSHLHHHQVVHRDLKPSNVFVTESGSVVLLDLGSAHEAGSDLTRTGTIIGTPLYLAPEQILGARDLDGRADVYALGALGWEMLTGAPPFTGAVNEVLQAHLHQTPDLSALQQREVPDALQQLLQRALSIRRDERPSVDAFAAELPGADGAQALNASGLKLPVRPTRKQVDSQPEAVPTALVPANAPASSEVTQIRVSPLATPHHALEPVTSTAASSEVTQVRHAPVPVSVLVRDSLLDDAPAQPADRTREFPARPAGELATATHRVALEAPTGPSKAIRKSRVTLAVVGSLVLTAVWLTALFLPTEPDPVAPPLKEKPMRVQKPVEVSREVKAAAAVSVPALPPTPALTTELTTADQRAQSYYVGDTALGAQRGFKPNRSPPKVGLMRITTTLDGLVVPARLRIDGRPLLDLTPVVVPLSPGMHKLRIEYEDDPPMLVSYPMPEPKRQTMGEVLEIELRPSLAQRSAEPTDWSGPRKAHMGPRR